MKVILLALIFLTFKGTCQVALPVSPESDTAKYHFVRFLQLNPRWPDVSHFSIGLDKIPSINRKSDPEVVDDLPEQNLITDVSSYMLVKKFISQHLSYLQIDAANLYHRQIHGSYKVVIDFKKYYYLKYDKADGFFAELVAYIKIKKMDSRIIDLIIHRE